MFFLRGYENNAVDDHDVQFVRLTTATGEAVEAATGKRSTFSLHDGRSVSIRYTEADVTFPTVVAREATQQGKWFVFGLGTKLVVAHQDGQRVERSLHDAQSVYLVLEQVVYWLDCHDTLVQSGTLFSPVRPAAKLVEAPDFGRIILVSRC